MSLKKSQQVSPANMTDVKNFVKLQETEDPCVPDNKAEDEKSAYTAASEQQNQAVARSASCSL
jgi:hypothetical protein